MLKNNGGLEMVACEPLTLSSLCSGIRCVVFSVFDLIHLYEVESVWSLWWFLRMYPNDSGLSTGYGRGVLKMFFFFRSLIGASQRYFPCCFRLQKTCYNDPLVFWDLGWVMISKSNIASRSLLCVSTTSEHLLVLWYLERSYLTWFQNSYQTSLISFFSSHDGL